MDEEHACEFLDEVKFAVGVDVLFDHFLPPLSKLLPPRPLPNQLTPLLILYLLPPLLGQFAQALRFDHILAPANSDHFAVIVKILHD